MAPNLRNAGRFLYRRAENVLAAMLGAMFLAFILQIAFRYLLNRPTGWTNEISVILWIWIVLWGAAFVLTEAEEIRFDILFGAASGWVRRGMVLASAAALVTLYTVSMPAVFDYVSFMRVQDTAYLDLPFDWVFSIYVVFALASIVRYLWLGWRAIVGGDEPDRDPTKAGSGI